MRVNVCKSVCVCSLVHKQVYTCSRRCRSRKQNDVTFRGNSVGMMLDRTVFNHCKWIYMELAITSGTLASTHKHSNPLVYQSSRVLVYSTQYIVHSVERSWSFWKAKGARKINGIGAKRTQRKATSAFPVFSLQTFLFYTLLPVFIILFCQTFAGCR